MVEKTIDQWEEKDLDMGGGLPQGDTVIDLETTTFELVSKTYDEKVTERFQFQHEENLYSIPKGVMADIKRLRVDESAKKVRITRTGQQKETRYTVVKVE